MLPWYIQGILGKVWIFFLNVAIITTNAFFCRANQLHFTRNYFWQRNEGSLAILLQMKSSNTPWIELPQNCHLNSFENKQNPLPSRNEEIISTISSILQLHYFAFLVPTSDNGLCNGKPAGISTGMLTKCTEDQEHGLTKQTDRQTDRSVEEKSFFLLNW